MMPIVISERQPTARVVHRCCECGRQIDPGETYSRSVWVDNGINVVKRCTHCRVVCDWYWTNWDIGYGDDYDLANWLEANSIAEARVIAQFRRRWRRRDGGLYPVPVLVTETRSPRFGRGQFRVTTGIRPGDAA